MLTGAILAAPRARWEVGVRIWVGFVPLALRRGCGAGTVGAPSNRVLRPAGVWCGAVFASATAAGRATFQLGESASVRRAPPGLRQGSTGSW